MSWRFLTVVGLFITCLLTSNVIAPKLLTVSGITVSVAVIVFPLSYIVADVLTEVWGYAAARRVIWLGFACNAVMALAIWLAGVIPPAPFWKGQGAYDTILGQTPRIVAASFGAYLAGEFTNSFVLAKLKIATRGRWLWTRTIGSTVIGQAVDTAVFVTAAFAGVLPGALLGRLIFGQWLLKVLYEVVATPLTYAIVGWLKSREGVDTYDWQTDFNPTRL